MNSMYSLMSLTVGSLLIGESTEIDSPNNLRYFRKYLSEYSKAQGKKFTTKVISGTLHIMRVKYSNIHSKEVE
jgi:hypothetical protein